MPALTVPNHELQEFNPCHTPAGSSTGGQFCTTTGSTAGTSYARPKILQVRTVEEAVALIAKGHTVELPDTRSVNTLLDKLAAMALDAKARGEKAPHYDLCKVSVKGTNLFCTDKVRTREFPDGVPRLHMPQFMGMPVPGSPADKLPKDNEGRVDGAEHFIAHLESLGIKTTKGTEKAARLKATQSELDGVKVAGMMTSPRFDPHRGRIFTSRDHYVIDGHHRWAAVVGFDAANNELGDIEMNTVKVDAPIAEVLFLARTWSQTFGIRSASAK